jgi:hypothetical protein
VKPGFAQKLTANEKDLIKISLAQNILSNSEDQPTLDKVLDAYFLLIDESKENDAEFDVLESFVEANSKNQRYPSETIARVAEQASSIRVSS